MLKAVLKRSRSKDPTLRLSQMWSELRTLCSLDRGRRLVLRRAGLVLGLRRTADSGTHWECLSGPGHRGLCTTSQVLCTRVGEWKSSKFWTALCDVWMVFYLTPVETGVCLFRARLRENSKDKRQEAEAYRCCFHKVFVFLAVKTTCPSVSFWVLLKCRKKKKAKMFLDYIAVGAQT